MGLCIFTGYIGFMQRTNNIAKLVKKDFPDIEISSIVFGRHNYDFLNKQMLLDIHPLTVLSIIKQIDRENILFQIKIYLENILDLLIKLAMLREHLSSIHII